MRFGWYAIVGGIGSCVLACGARTAERPAQASAHEQVAGGSQVVARVGGTLLTREDIQAELDRLPREIRMRFDSKERRVDFLERVVELELLAQEARRVGLERDPEVIRRVRDALVSSLAREIVSEAKQLQPIREADLLGYYRANLVRYQTPGDATSPAKTPALSEVRERVWNDLLRQRRTAALRRYVRRLRENSKVQRFEDNLAQGSASAGAASNKE